MKRFLALMVLFLMTMAPMAYAEEEDPKMPFNSTCVGVSGNEQEKRWCVTWDKALQGLSEIRVRQPDDRMGLHAMVLVEFCKRTNTLGVSTTVIFVSDYFGGQYPWVLSSLKVVEPGDWTDITKELAEDMWDAFGKASEGLGVAIELLNTRSKKDYQSVGGDNSGADYPDLYDPFERDDPWNIELC